MDNLYFFIHHLPCSYRCENTIKLAKKVEEKIREVEPEFVKKTIKLLKKPLLVFGERNFIIFDGQIKSKSLNYTNAQYISNPARVEETIDFFDSVKDGNKITINQDKLHIMNDGSLIRKVNKKQEWFMIGFD